MFLKKLFCSLCVLKSYLHIKIYLIPLCKQRRNIRLWENIGVYIAMSFLGQAVKFYHRHIFCPFSCSVCTSVIHLGDGAHFSFCNRTAEFCELYICSADMKFTNNLNKSTECICFGFSNYNRNILNKTMFSDYICHVHLIELLRLEHVYGSHTCWVEFIMQCEVNTLMPCHPSPGQGKINCYQEEEKTCNTRHFLDCRVCILSNRKSEAQMRFPHLAKLRQFYKQH